MRTNLLTKSLITAALLILAIPIVASAQFYRSDRGYGYDRDDRRDVRDAIFRLDNSSTRLENDLNYTPARRVFGIFQFRTVDNTAIAEVRDFRRAVRQLGYASAGGRDLNASYERLGWSSIEAFSSTAT